MRLRLTSATAAGLVLLLSLAACGGGDSTPAALPAKGTGVCTDIKNAKRMRYAINYTLESARQANPPDDSSAGDFVVKPSQPDFNFQVNYTGAFVTPDKLDYQLSSSPDQPSIPGIRIGKAEWFQLNGSWVPNSQPISGFVFTPPIFCDTLVAPLELGDKTATIEKVGDVEARHVRINGASVPIAAQLFGDKSDNGRLLNFWDIDLWLRKDKDRLVKVEAVSKASYPYGREMSSNLALEISAFNDSDIPDINPPI